jgi:hypothetical protein
MAEAPFSRRHGYSGQAQEITIREDAPESLRAFVLSRAEHLGLRPDPREAHRSRPRRRPRPR